MTTQVEFEADSAAMAGAAARKRVLVAAINYAPEEIGCGKYTTELSEYLSLRGYEVEVLTAPPHYPGWFVRRPYRWWSYSTEMRNGVRVMRCPMAMKRNAPGLWRLIAPLSFAICVSPLLLWRMVRLRPNVVVCVEPTLFASPLVVLAAKLIGARTFLHVQDLEVDAAFRIGHLKGGWLGKAGGLFERVVLRGFDQIITISEKMRAALIQKGVEATKIDMIRDWVNIQAIWPKHEAGQNPFRRELGIDDRRFVVLYAGHVGAKQGLDVLLDAARQLQDDAGILFVIAGDGPCKEALMRDFRDLRNLEFLPLQPASRLNDLLNLASLHALPQDHAAADLVLPSKLTGMLASGRPIVATAAAGTELAELLRDIAIIAPPGDSRALARAISDARSRDMTAEVAKGLSLAREFSAERILPLFEATLLGEPSDARCAAE